MEYFYDKQFKRYISQVIRLFSDFKVDIGTSGDGTPLYRTVPVNYGDISRMAANILKNNSENVLNTAPFFSIYITGLEMAPDRRTYQQFTHDKSIIEKKFDETTGEYINEPGDRYQVTRHNPVPYNLSINVDLWTTNNDQKFQLFEQVLILYNPSVNLRSNSSPADWSSLTYIEMTNSNWSSRSIPSGPDDVIDVATFQFKLPILLNPPVKVKRETLIHSVITKLDVVDGDNLKLFDARQPFESQYRSYSVITLENYRLLFENGRAIILNRNGGNTDEDGNLLDWNHIFNNYGNFREGISQIRLRMSNIIDDDSNDIIAVIDSIDPVNTNELLLTVDTDTLPADTLSPIDAVIDPQQNYPNDGTLPVESIGQRYLLTDEVGQGGIWDVDAVQNDIIEYNGASWQVVFDSNSSSSIEYVYDSDQQEQYEWDGSTWKQSYTGIYNNGFWRLYL
jgi:hypothetical protein